MGAEMATDEVTDIIASIEMQRQEAVKEAGLAAACSEALRKLHELLDREKKALQLHGSSTQHSANIEAVLTEIKKVKKLAEITSRGSIPKSARPGQRQVSWQNKPRNPSRSRGRRTMGRSSGR
ncbi:MAG: hypothetical protein ACHP6J_04665 [Burkholderiales bacterium]